MISLVPPCFPILASHMKGGLLLSSPDLRLETFQGVMDDSGQAMTIVAIDVNN